MAHKRRTDTTVMEYTAEDLIAHKLQRGGLLVAKPKFDRDGADLLALVDAADGGFADSMQRLFIGKFGKVQCRDSWRLCDGRLCSLSIHRNG